MKQVKISTIMREELARVGLWRPCFTKTYQDNSYTSRMMRKRWASKFLDQRAGFTYDDGCALAKVVGERIKAEGHDISRASWSEWTLLVYQEKPCTITVAD